MTLSFTRKRDDLDALYANDINELQVALENHDVSIGNNTTNVANHVANTTNPHNVTKTQVGLGSVPNVDATNRANHTGTQTAATISDFATAVTGTAAVQRAETRIYDARAYGAVVDRTAINSAISAANNAGGAVAYVPAGTCDLSEYVDLLAGVTLRGAGRNRTVLRSTAGTKTLRVLGDDVTVEDLTIDTNNLSMIGTSLEPTVGPIKRVTFRRCRFLNAGNSVIRCMVACEDITIEDCSFVNSQGISFNLSPASGTGIRIVRNTFRGMISTQPHIQLFAPSTTRLYSDVLIADNILLDPASTTIPIELTGCAHVAVTGNIIGGPSTRGVSTSRCTDLLITNNVIRDQSTYAVEIGNSDVVSIVGNVVRNCAALVHETAAFVTDLLIADNDVVGTGLTAAVAGGYTVKLALGATRVRITGNSFTDWQYLAACIRVGDTNTATDVTVTDNTFTVSDPATPLGAISLRKAQRAVAANNVIRITRDLGAGDDYASAINPVIDVSAADQIIRDNTIRFTGAVAAAPNAAGISNGNVGAAALPGLRVERNRVLNGPRGIRLVVNSADLVVTDNDTRSCANADVIPSTALRRMQARYEMSAAPTTGAWTVGDLVWNTAPVESGTAGSKYIVSGWVCTVSGSPGTWLSLRALTGN